MTLERLATLLGLALAACAATAQPKPAPVSMTLNWFPQADHGGYFAAKAEGLYDKAGLDVTLRPGGPQVNVHQLLAAGQTDFIMGTQMRTLNARAQGIPIVSVAAWFQKDPQTMLVHDGAGNDSLAALKGKPIYLPGIARNNYWPWLKSRFGLGDDQIKPYDPSFRALAMDKTAASQGYLTIDAYQMDKLGVKSRSLLLADYGWNAYVSTLDTTEKVIAERPEMVRAFVKATAEGWKRYLANPAPAHALIKQMNPQQEDALMNVSYKIIREAGLVDSGDAKAGKLGVMTDARWEGFLKDMVAAGALASQDVKKAYPLQFVKEL